MYTTASDLLQAVYDDLKQPGRRTKGVYARNARGNAIYLSSPSAVCWCTDGKMIQLLGADRIGGLIVVRHEMAPQYHAARAALDATKPSPYGTWATLETTNDDLDDEQWEQWMLSAIAYAKQQEALDELTRLSEEAGLYDMPHQAVQ